MHYWPIEKPFSNMLYLPVPPMVQPPPSSSSSDSFDTSGCAKSAVRISAEIPTIIFTRPIRRPRAQIFHPPPRSLLLSTKRVNKFEIISTTYNFVSVELEITVNAIIFVYTVFAHDLVLIFTAVVSFCWVQS